MRTTFDFAPLWRSTIGFDHLADLVDSTLRQATDDNYPPYNIERSSEDQYRITLAVAGFGARRHHRDRRAERAHDRGQEARGATRANISTRASPRVRSAACSTSPTTSRSSRPPSRTAC